MSLPQEPRVAHLPWDEVARRIDASAAAILPIGAGAKEHGLHLPMNADQIQAEWLAETVAAKVDALIWPTVTYGYYPAFTAYAGSASLSAETFKAVVGEIAAWLLSYGVPAVLILDTALSTIPPLDELLEQMNDPRLHYLKVYEGSRYIAAAQSLREQSYGTHADELETSRMLALDPDVVAMSRAKPSPMPDRFRGPLTPHDANAPGYSPSGSYGDPTLATQKKGAMLQNAMTEDVIEMAQRALGIAD